VKILFLSHRIPYPPDKGDKIRSFRLLEALASRHDVRLVTHADDPRDLKHVPELLRRCRTASVYPVSAAQRVARSLGALLSGRAVSFAKFHDRRAAREVRAILEADPPDVVVVFSAQPAEYLPEGLDIPVVIDLVDVDSEKWATYASSARGLMRWIYGREARLVRAFERRLAGLGSRISVATEREAALFRQAVSPRGVAAVPNGVDLGPRTAAGARVPGLMVLAGAMNYAANEEAAVLAAREVLPLVRKQAPDATLRIVGRNPGRTVRALGRLPGVTVTGEVPAMAPELERAEVSLVPLRLVRGLPTKVLESFAHGIPVVATSEVLAAVGAEAGVHALGADDAAGLAEAAALLLQDAALRDRIGEAGRSLASERFRWDRFESGMLGLVEDVVHAGARS
jgi:polysaccharide biosynthesis protein PslH